MPLGSPQQVDFNNSIIDLPIPLHDELVYNR
jgi:hypothetical protein